MPLPAPGAFERRFRHPPGLAILFLTEMWERFSYYGMRGLLVLYMVRHLFQPGRPEQVAGYGLVKGALEAVFGPLAPQPLASQVYGLYTGLVYLTPFFGGILADRVLGQRRSVTLGAVLMAVGHFLMASERLFFVALLFLIAGNGCFKPNISTHVGLLYPPGDPRRDRAFSIFYMGINLGAFFANLVCATLAFKLGWHWGFGAAGVGMCVGLATWLWGQRYLRPHAAPSPRAEAAARAPLTAEERRRVWALVALCALNVVFWAVYEQQGNTMQLWADEQTVWPTILGWQVPSPWYQSFNPFLIFLLTPLLTVLWTRQARRGTEPSTVSKMALGCLLLGLSFLLMVAGARIVGGGKGSLFWPLATTLILTVGELYLSPIGLSLVTKVAPARIVSMMMGIWFLSSFFGNYLSGYLGTYYERMPREAFFLVLSVLGVASAAAMWAFNRPLKRALGEHG